MTAPNVEIRNLKQQIGKGAQDGLSLYPPTLQKASPSQALVQGWAGGQIVTYQETLTPALIAGNTTAEQALTVGTTAGNGPLTTDFVAAINKPTAQAGIGFHGARISAANTLQFVYSNTTAGNLTPTAAEVHNVTLIRGVAPVTQTLTPVSVAARTTSEQVFTLAPTPATATSVIANGSVSEVRMTGAGANYFSVPGVVFTSVDGAGSGAEGIAVIAGGAVIGVAVTKGGSEYNAAPIVSFVGGNTVSKGMALMVTKPTTNAGVAIGGCRVVDNNQVAITFVNPTAAAVTPTAAQVYSFMALNTVPSITNVTSYGMMVGTLALVAGNTTAEQAVTVTGLVATDICVGVQKPSLQAGICIAQCRVSAANTVGLSFGNFTGGNLTPTANEIYGLTAYNQVPTNPFQVYKQLLTPVSVAANTTAEQTFTVTGLPAGSTVFVNKPSHQVGLVISGCRVTAASTLGITYENITANALTPTPEVYTIGNFPAVGPGGGVPGSWVALAVNTSINQTVNLSNQEQLALVESGAIRGY